MQLIGKMKYSLNAWWEVWVKSSTGNWEFMYSYKYWSFLFLETTGTCTYHTSCHTWGKAILLTRLQRQTTDVCLPALASPCMAIVKHTAVMQLGAIVHGVLGKLSEKVVCVHIATLSMLWSLLSIIIVCHPVVHCMHIIWKRRIDTQKRNNGSGKNLSWMSAWKMWKDYIKTWSLSYLQLQMCRWK